MALEQGALVARPGVTDALSRWEAALRREVFAIIDRHPRPTYLPDLYRFAGMLSALLALASSDLQQHYAAESHADPRYSTARPAIELREQIDVFRAYPAARELPELSA